MNTLSTFQGKHSVWSQESGAGIVIVIDDEVMGFSDRVLSIVFQGCIALSDIRAIGFFQMPSSVENIENEVFVPINSWLESLNSQTQRLYFLVDAYFGQQSDDDKAVGREIYRCVPTRYPGARYRYLSKAGAPTIEDGEAALDDGFYKSHIEDAWVASKKRSQTPRLPADFISWLEAQPPRASAIWSDVTRWNEFRKIVASECFRLRPIELNCSHGMWAHHLLGNEYPALAPNLTIYEKCFRSVKETLLIKCHQISFFPEFEWTQDDIDIGGAFPVKGWDRPPIRSLIQFDGLGKDLSCALKLLSEDLKRVLGNAIELAWTFPVPKKLDWLWFPISGLGEGLRTLAEQFRDEVGGIDLDSGCSVKLNCEGRIMASDERNPLSLVMAIKIHQQIGASHLPYPDPIEVEGKLRRSYDQLKGAGALIKVDEGDLVATVTACFNASLSAEYGIPIYEVNDATKHYHNRQGAKRVP